MPSASKLRKRTTNKQAHAAARSAVYTSVNPAEVTGRIFTSKEEEELPLHMRDGNVMRRGRGVLTNEACVNRICDLVARGVTETEARQYIGVSATEWGQWRRSNECFVEDKLKFAIEMQHIASADECIKLLSQLRAERRTGFKSYNEAMRVYQQELSDWYAIPKDERGARPAEPVYDGPTCCRKAADARGEGLDQETGPAKKVGLGRACARVARRAHARSKNYAYQNWSEPQPP